jgi:hypothetical protein
MKGYLLLVFLFALAAYFKPYPYIRFMEIFFIYPLVSIEVFIVDILGIDMFIPRIKL